MAKTYQKEKINPARFLDCGSGTGLLGGAVRKLWPDAHITGIDFADDMLDQSVTDGCADDIVLFDLMKADWPVEDESFDLVGAASVINYAADPHQFISNMADATRKGGHVMLSYLTGQKNTQSETDDGTMSYLWSGQEIKDCFAECEIELISSRDTQTYTGRGLHRIDSIIIGFKGHMGLPKRPNKKAP